MTNLLVTWFLSAVSLLIVARPIKGFEVGGFGAALIAAVVIDLPNGTVGFFLKIVTFPLTILTLGFNGFLPALIGALVLSLVNLLLRTLLQA